MQATKTIKPSKWQKMWRRLTRRTPFWGRRLPELTDGELEPERGVLGAIAKTLIDAANLLYPLVIGAVAISLLASVVIGPIFLSPDFMTVGLADPIGRGLAAVCLSTGQCNPAYLLAGTAVAVLILLLLGYAVVVAITGDDADDAAVSESELLSGLGALDERVVHLRAELVLANVLPLSKEEAEEIAGDFVENATPEQRAAFYDAAAKLLRGGHVD